LLRETTKGIQISLISPEFSFVAVYSIKLDKCVYAVLIHISASRHHAIYFARKLISCQLCIFSLANL